jgi:tRNA(adenine34) deaminase
MKEGMDYNRFMGEALKEARKALARGDFPVGCVVVHQDKIVVRSSRRGTRDTGDNELDHAEMLALRKLAAAGRKGQPMPPRAVTVFSTMEPCLMCFSALILHDVAEIVYSYEDVMGGGASCKRHLLRPLYRDSRIHIHPGVRRAESLALFQTYFNDPSHSYWRGSYLAEYTLNQQA